KPNIITYNSMMKAYLDHNYGINAFQLYQIIKNYHLNQCNPITYTLALNSCASIFNIHEGKIIHQYINNNHQLQNHIIIQTTLIHMYNKCDHLNQSIQIFNNIKNPNIITYNSIMKAYLDHNKGNKAFQLYQIIK